MVWTRDCMDRGFFHLLNVIILIVIICYLLTVTQLIYIFIQLTLIEAIVVVYRKCTVVSFGNMSKITYYLTSSNGHSI